MERHRQETKTREYRFLQGFLLVRRIGVSFVHWIGYSSESEFGSPGHNARLGALNVLEQNVEDDCDVGEEEERGGHHHHVRNVLQDRRSEIE